ncbi:MAG TPA: tetratricopeptide repeat protein, partial [Polyangia bacterium]
VHAAFAATAVPYAEAAFTTVAQAFDRYAHDWAAMRTDACEATQLRHEQSAELLDLRMSCLDDRLTQLGTLSDVYAAADARVVEHANDWAAALPGLAPCADAVALRAPTPPPRDPEARRRVEAIRHDLARAHALGLALKADEGLALVRAAEKEAEAVGYRPVEAEAQLRLGELMQIKGDFAGAPAVLHRGLTAALASRADEIAADIAIASLEVDLHQSHFPDAERWADLAEALASRLSRKDGRLGQIYTSRANILRYESKLEPALVEAKRGLALLQKVYGPDDYRVALAWKALALIYYYRTEYPPALDAYQHALELQQRALGPDHPRVVTALIGIADVYGDSGDHDKAIAIYRQALDKQLRIDPNHQNVELVYGNMSNDYLQLGRPREAYDLLQKSLERIKKRIGPSMEMVFALTNLGLADVEMHKWNEALDLSEQAMAMCEKLVGQNSLQYGQALAGSARAMQGLGRLEEADALYHRTLALDEKVLGPKHPELVVPLLGLGQVALLRGNPAAARAPLERGLVLTEGFAILDVEACDYQLALAKVEWASGNRARALELAQRAHAGYVKAGTRGKEGLAEANAWLAAHHG